MYVWKNINLISKTYLRWKHQKLSLCPLLYSRVHLNCLCKVHLNHPHILLLLIVVWFCRVGFYDKSIWQFELSRQLSFWKFIVLTWNIQKTNSKFIIFNFWYYKNICSWIKWVQLCWIAIFDDSWCFYLRKVVLMERNVKKD